MNSSVEKLALLRAALRQKSIDAYIIPNTDPHLGEEIQDHWKTIKWLTGFTGSSATVVVTDSFAGLWTDSRYIIQAGRELKDSGFSLAANFEGNWVDYSDYLAEKLVTGSRVGLDGRLFSIGKFRSLRKKLEGKNITISDDCDLISDIWSGRPGIGSSMSFDHPVEFSGRERALKISDVREIIKNRNVCWHLLTARDDIMWLLNIRGRDLEYSPLMDSFALIGEQQVLLFADEAMIPLKVASEFDKIGIVLLPYEDTEQILFSVTRDSSVLLDPATVSVRLYNSVSKRAGITEDISIPLRLKAVKNKTEIDNIGKVMVRDGTALTKFFFWLENKGGTQNLTEAVIAEKLLEFRSTQDTFLGPSFMTIAAFGENSALPHYTPDPGNDSAIGDKGILLLDSGGQYLGGTTDITRTIPVGIPSPEQKRDFTLVLKGHIALALAKFPSGTKGYQLDILARKALWDAGLNYGHGTGHGVGFCLNVHEGPQSISPAYNKTPVEPGMLISNEPAIYREGEYGIRIENLVLCYEDEVTEFGRFLKFDTVSLCYIEKSLIDRSLLDRREVSWLNFYHAEVYEKLSPYLTPEEKVWLKEKTDPL